MRAQTRKVVDKHLDWVRLLGRAERTLHLREGTLIRLDRFLGNRDILQATGDDLEAFLAIPSKIASTRRVEISHLRQFYHWTTARELTKRNPTLLLPVPRTPRRLPRPIPIPDAATAIALASPDVALILGLACMAGLRADEISRLRGTDVLWDHDPPLLHIRGKGDKDRRVPVPPQLATILADAPRSGWLVRYKDPKRQLERFPAFNVSSRANQYLYSLGLQSVHKLRHTAGTWFYQASGHDLLMTQRFLGHSSPISTQVYVDVCPDDMSDVSAKFKLPLPDNLARLEQS